MQRIVPNIWTNRSADAAAAFYIDAFPEAHVVGKTYYPEEGLPDFQKELAGETMTVILEINGYRLVLINAGDEFEVNPSVSFFLNFDPAFRIDARGDLDRVWQYLSEGGTVLMELGEYPFSKRYGWVQDKFGVSWQIILTDPEADQRPFVIPSLLFSGPAQNRAAEAEDFYRSVFPDSAAGNRAEYPEPTGPAVEGAVMFSDFQLYGEWLTVMDSGVEQTFTFNPGISLQVNVPGQQEVDRLWGELSAVPEAEQCGWLADRFGVSWQITPDNLEELLERPGAYEKFMGMKKIETDQF